MEEKRSFPGTSEPGRVQRFYHRGSREIISCLMHNQFLSNDPADEGGGGACVGGG